MASEWRNPRYDIKREAPRRFDQALTVSMGLVVMVFLTNQRFDLRAYEPDRSFAAIEVEEIPETVQLRQPPAPQRPQIPIATESEDIPDDVTIMDTDLDLDAPPPPPPPPPGSRTGIREESPIFMVWEEAPQLIKMVTPTYPKLARQANVTGRVYLQIVVDEEGNVIDAQVVASNPAGIFEDAAITAVMQWKYKPARQRDLPIRVRMGQAVDFVLTDITRPPPD
jgi:protein TonB